MGKGPGTRGYHAIRIGLAHSELNVLDNEVSEKGGTTRYHFIDMRIYILWRDMTVFF